jgi:hypothetical protein
MSVNRTIAIHAIGAPYGDLKARKVVDLDEDEAVEASPGESDRGVERVKGRPWGLSELFDSHATVGACALTVGGLRRSNAFPEVGDVVMVDDERPGQHGLEGGGEAALRTPCEVVVVVVALSPLRDSGDVIWVVLIADDPDDFAAIVLKALSEDLDQKVGDILSTARQGKELRRDQGAHLAYSS